MKKIVSIILAALATIGFTFGATGCSEKAQTAIENVGGMITGAIEENGISLKTVAVSADEVAATAESAIEVTATITPATATNKNVTYSVAWSDASSTWASGKTVTSYVTVSQATTGSLTATVTCLQAFGEPIVLTCASEENTEVTATLQIDYVKRITGSPIVVQNQTMSTHQQSGTLTGNILTAIQVKRSASPTFGTGTMSNTLVSSGVSVQFNDNFLDDLNSATGYTFDTPIRVYEETSFTFILALLFTIDGEAVSETEHLNAISSWLADNASKGLILVQNVVEVEYGAGIDQLYGFGVTASDLTISVTNVALSSSSIVF